MNQPTAAPRPHAFGNFVLDLAAARLLRDVTAGILARGEKAFLHSYADNATAIGLYESLGYRGRREVVFTILRAAQ